MELFAVLALALLALQAASLLMKPSEAWQREHEAWMIGCTSENVISPPPLPGSGVDVGAGVGKDGCTSRSGEPQPPAIKNEVKSRLKVSLCINMLCPFDRSVNITK